MKTNNELKIVCAALIVLGMVMIYLGGFAGPKIAIPPIITGIGFFAIAWAFIRLRK